ncbi:hypothetical protein N8087_00310 [Porticoccaceae bacterium]|nr:hypothetical protein [Porticoccaceae bacterium]
MKIVCGKYHNSISNTLAADFPRRSMRIGSKNPNKLEIPNYRLISTNGQVILDGVTSFNVRAFLKYFKPIKSQRLIVLTHKEKELLLQHLLDFNMVVDVFEDKYPCFPSIKYNNNLNHNLSHLLKGIKKITAMGITGGSIARHVSTTFQYKVERKIRKKQNIDKCFGFAYTGGYQEVFKLSEARPGRKVIAMDFNSMFLACMQGSFPDPRTLYRKKINKFHIRGERLNAGVYRVVLKDPLSNFIRNYHWFRYVEIGKKRSFSLNDDFFIEVLLHHSELEYLIKHFKDIYIKEAIISDESIEHPLLKAGNKIYKNRLQANKNKDQILEKYCKSTLAMLHSVTNSKHIRKVNFKTIDSMINYMDKNLSINLADKNEGYLMHILNKMVGFSFQKKENYFCLQHPFFDHKDQILSMSSTVLANSRVKVLKTIEKLLDFPTSELCYVNIDSIHISLDESLLSDFIKENSDLISDDYGMLKIECIADQGYWLGVGRYWLLNGNEVVQFKNKIFNRSFIENPFCFHRKLNRIIKNTTFKYIKPISIQIDRFLDYSKPISEFDSSLNINYRRFRYDEISNHYVAAESERKEALASKALKMSLLDMIATGKVSATRRETRLRLDQL